MPNKKQKVVQLHLDPSIKSLWVDNLHMAVRDDDVGVIRLSTNLPEGLFEQIRFMTGKKQLKEFVDIICATIDYFPSEDKIKTKLPKIPANTKK